jgi:hypothetical protein
MRTFVLAYDRREINPETDKEVKSDILLGEIIELLIKEGAEGIRHILASTIVFTCDNRYVYKHWEHAISEFKLDEKAYYSLSEVYQGSSRHMVIVPSDKINEEEFQKKVVTAKSIRTNMPTSRF